jgi:pimeloyl-ACP methyl ester carboxylesterase
MTFVLVHGGGYDHRCWLPLMSHLDGEVVAVDLPGRGKRPVPLGDVAVVDFVDAVVDEITSRDLHEVVLVGHSLAGITLPSVAVRIPDRISRLVFVSCAIPAPGTAVVDALGSFSPATAAVAAQLGDEILTPTGTLHPDLAASMFFNDLDADQQAFALEIMVPESYRVVSETLGSTGLPTAVPTTYVRLLRDESVSLTTQDEMLARLGRPSVVDLDAGHMAMISQPQALASLLNAIATAS